MPSGTALARASVRSTRESHSMNKLRKFASLTLVAPLAFTLAACGGGPATPSATGAPASGGGKSGTLTVWCWDPAFNIYAMNEAAKIYAKDNPDVKVNVIFRSGKDTIYSGECLIFKQTGDKEYRDIVLEPLNFEIQRFKPREYRSSRQQLVPSPDVVIRHPLTGKDVQLKIHDMSGSGFSVEENEEDAVLLPGLVTPETTLKFANNFTLRCRGQVIYSIPEDSQQHAVKCPRRRHQLRPVLGLDDHIDHGVDDGTVDTGHIARAFHVSRAGMKHTHQLVTG